MTKYNYLFRSLVNFNHAKKCPYCSSPVSRTIDRKFFVTTLNECSECNLLFRHPLDSYEFNQKFYQEEYEQDDKLTTDLPTPAHLEQLLRTNFSDTRKDFSAKINLIKNLVKNRSPKIVDFGANWGYASYQLKKEGFEVQSYEISKPRAAYGKHLGIDIFTDESMLKENVDVFFSSHVIEHLPDIKMMFRLSQKLINENGFFVSFCPNGSEEFKQKNPESFHHFWGQVHPNFLNANFYAKAFRDVPYLIGSNFSSDNDILQWNQESQTMLDLSGHELFVIAKLKNQKF
ncbi:MAG: methyltransferase domain-containing protein [Chitinophagaceae bacterium]